MNFHAVTVLWNCYSSDGVHQNHGNHRLGLMWYVSWHTRKALGWKQMRQKSIYSSWERMRM